MKSYWEGRYLDGKTASPKKAFVNLWDGGLEITIEDGPKVIWPYDEIKQVQGNYSGEPVRLEHGSDLVETLTIADTAFLTALREQTPRMAGHFHNPAFRRTRAWLTFYAALATLAVSFVFYRWGIPAVADHLTPLLPVRWEMKMGESQLDLLAPKGQRMHVPAVDRAMRQIVARLTGPLKKIPYRFQVTVVNMPIFNAFALPGGNIVVFRSLLEATHSPEELAGVLAHEMQHVLKRHTTKRMIQDSSTAILLSALSGDATGSTAFALQSAAKMALLQYDRDEEAEADREGMNLLLAAKINPKGMINFFRVLQTKEKLPEYVKFVSDHPATQDRIQMLEKLATARKPGAASIPLLPNTNWGALTRRVRQVK